MSTDPSDFVLDFVNVGPQRTGTSWLHQILKHHPQICLPPAVKETMFFDRDYQRGLDWYAHYFRHRQSNQRCGEVAPTYFDLEEIPERIRAVNPDCKIMIHLRHPVQRALSLYHHHFGKGRVHGAFSDAILQMPRIVDAGKYAVHISRWFDSFGPEQVMFVLLDDIESRPESTLESIYQFLDVEPIAMPELGHEKFGAAVMPAFPELAKLTAQTATWLRSHQLHHIAELGKTLGFKKIYSGKRTQLPSLTLSEQLTLVKTYEEDVLFVETLLGRELSTWHQV